LQPWGNENLDSCFNVDGSKDKRRNDNPSFTIDYIFINFKINFCFLLLIEWNWLQTCGVTTYLPSSAFSSPW
jgi:hypothetical protein